MNALVTSESRFARTPDGSVWASTVDHYDFWTRYLDVFDQVRVLGRVRNVDTPEGLWRRADGDGVSIVPVPFYLGPAEYLMRARQVNRAVGSALRTDEAVVLRAYSQIATVLEEHLRQSARPYGVEVVADPLLAFAPSASRHPLRSLFRRVLTKNLRRQCANAAAVAYVTERFLQQRYPASERAFVSNCSDVRLTPDAFVAAPREHAGPLEAPSIVTVGSLAHLLKGTDVLIGAVAKCRAEGLQPRLTIIGDGKHRQELEGQAADLGLDATHVHFLGSLPAGEPVRNALDAADIFVLPSRAEGLPRVLLEAMARGLPCISTAVGGIPEVLPAVDMVPPNDRDALSAKILEVARDPSRLSQMSSRNLRKAQEFRDSVLRARWNDFYRNLADISRR